MYTSSSISGNKFLNQMSEVSVKTIAPIGTLSVPRREQQFFAQRSSLKAVRFNIVQIFLQHAQF